MSRDYEKFFTPNHIALYMAGLLGPKHGDAILEPAAGKGALVRAVKQHDAGAVVFAFEINEEYRQWLRNAGANIVVIRDFLETPERPKFSNCIANPPFGNDIDLQAWFDKIRQVVNIGGKIVMIVPEEFDPKVEHIAHPLENWSKNSDGTETKIKIIEFYNQ